MPRPLVLIAFALANLAAWAGWWQWSARDRALVRIEDFSPGDGAVCARSQPWTLRFNLPMVADADAPVVGAPVLVHPGVDGGWRWRDERTLAFTPDRPLQPATRFSLAVPAGLRSRDGFTLARGFAASVHTPALAVVSVRPIGDDPHQVVLECTFSERVLPADVLARLSVTDQAGDRREPAWVDAAPATSVRLRVPLSASPSAKRTLTVVVRAGLVGTDGPLGLEADHVAKVVCDDDLRLTAVSARGGALEKPWLELRGNGALRIEDLRRVLALDPALPFTVGGDAYAARVEADFVEGQRYVLVVNPAPPGAVGRFPTPDRLPATFPDRPPGLRLAYERGQLGSRGRRALAAETVNLRHAEVVMHRLYDGNLVEWACRTQGNQGHQRYHRAPLELAQEVARTRLDLDAAPNRRQSLRLDLDRLLAGAAADGVYHVTLRAQPQDVRAGNFSAERWNWQLDDSAVISLSDLALSARVGGDAAVVWCTSLADATPQAGVRVRLFSRSRQEIGAAISDAHGLARIAVPPPARGEEPAAVIADRSPGDAAATHPRELTWLELSGRHLRDDRLASSGRPWLRRGHEAYVWSDRGVHRPGETVRLRAIVRGPDGALPPGDLPLRWRILRPDRREWRDLPAQLDADGLALCDLALPHDLPTGSYDVALGLPGAEPCGQVAVLVEEFLPDRLAARVDTDGAVAGRWRLGSGALAARVRGDWLFGQPAAGCAAGVEGRLEPTQFAAPAWTGWAFGDAAGLADELGLRPVQAHDLATVARALDSSGGATIALAGLDHAAGSWQPWRLLLTATVHEPGGRAVTARHDVIVDAQAQYLGLRRAPGSDPAIALIDVALVRPDGALASWSGSVQAQLQRVEWNNVLVEQGGELRYRCHRRLDPAGVAQTVSVVDGRAQFACPLPRAGSHVLCVRAPGDAAVATLSLARSQDGAWDESIDRERPEALDVAVVADEAFGANPVEPASRALVPGSTAAVIVKGPFPGHLLIAVETDRVVWTTSQPMPTTAARVALPVADWGPSAVVTATVVRAVRNDSAWRVHRAHGATAVRLDHSAVALIAGIAAPAQTRPGGDMEATVTVADASGRPLPGAVVLVAAVDEGVLRLTRHASPDPHGFFHGARRHQVTTWDAYARLMPEVPDEKEAPGGDGPGHYRSPVRVERVQVLAWSSGVLRSDDAGQVRVAVPLPASFAGAVRLMAVTVAGARSGAASRTVTVRSPLVVQAAWPRFLAPGDRCQVPITIFNRTGRAGRARLRLDSGGAPLAVGSSSAETDLAVDGTATLALALAAADAVGAAHATLHVELGDEHFQERIALPVRPAQPALSTTGVVIAAPDAPATLPASAPAVPGTTRLRVRVGPVPTLALPKALDELFRYPHGCAEQTVSSAFPLVHLAELGGRIAPGLFAPEAIRLRLDAGWARLATMQTADGGLGYWPGAHDTWDWASVYAAHFLHECAAAGHAPPRGLVERLDQWCRKRLERGDVNELTAYAAYALARGGQAPLPALARLEGGLAADATPATRCFVAGAWALAGDAARGRRLLPMDPPTARSGRDLRGWCGSPIRDRALVLATYIDLHGDHPALPELANALARDGLGGAWRSTQDLAWATFALGRWLRRAADSVPYDGIELRVDGAVVAVAGAGVALHWEAPPGVVTATVSVHCTGPAAARAHVDWLRDGVPLATPPAADHGVSVRRRYLTADGSALTGPLRLGQLVRVELVMDADADLANAVVEDLLPAGLEAENPRLATSAGAATPGPTDTRWQAQRLDVRDDRVIAFGDLPATPQRFVYLARAVTAGDFAVPPARVEAQYDSALRSLSGAGRLRVEP